MEWQIPTIIGLSVVKRMVGLPRNLKDIDGYEAVRLWWSYVNDYNEKALAILLEYNKEDAINLMSLKEKLL